MAHVRRKFVDVFASQGNAIAEEAICRIAELYAVEKDARSKAPEERLALRQARSTPIFDDLEAWLQAQLPKISGKSPLAQAIRYETGDYLLMRILLAGFFVLCAGAVSAAECVGRNLIDAMPDEQRADLEAAVKDVPYHNGILWQASKGGGDITVVGTYHFPNPRHQKMVRFWDLITC